MGKKKANVRPGTPIPNWIKTGLKKAPVPDVVKSVAHESARALFAKAEKAASGAPFATLPRPKLPVVFETRAGKRKRVSSPRYSPNATRISPEKKKRNIVKRCKKKAILWGQKTANAAKAIVKHPPKLTTSILMGAYTATFELTPSKYRALEQEVISAKTPPPPLRLNSPKTPAPPQRVSELLAQDITPVAARTPRIIKGRGVLVPFGGFMSNEEFIKTQGANTIGEALDALHYSPKPIDRYAFVVDNLKAKFGER
ncbi:Oidioi.mRNA.OKI2018_I69.PAR.g12379.t1.cds [Oikopleura dioica]|uniref:Oidioi.mRNA.OKI2018_I69.PAR.g12379.t1.cds n=1 Tax=Oikopleura dioica TaxID=34765 RepID=A0ABN7S4A8_OIKDI|nr:Oidioi.mRNA.OKI2018_I69.PAR.g12379.t1.cds [Oikopleura dioica]